MEEKSLLKEQLNGYLGDYSDLDMLVEFVQKELDRAREEGRREALENLHLKLNDCVVYINDNGDIDNGVIGSVNRSIVEELSKLTTK